MSAFKRNGDKACQQDTCVLVPQGPVLDLRVQAEPCGADMAERVSPVIPSQDELMQLGEGECAYIRSFFVDELRDLFPQTAAFPARMPLYALVGADGTPLVLADTREAVVAGAFENNLRLATVH